jgi:hypothetical protein
MLGYIPCTLAPKVSAFLRRDLNKGFAEVTGDKDSGYGLEVPCTLPSLWTKENYVHTMNYYFEYKLLVDVVSLSVYGGIFIVMQLVYFLFWPCEFDVDHIMWFMVHYGS